MASDKFFQHLRNELSKKSQVLTDQHHSDFKASLERWSNLDLQVPAAIVKPASEEDVVLTVRESIRASIPFVPAVGGHSVWSTINSEGFILDMTLYRGVVVEPSKQNVTIKGGVLMKELQVALNKEGQFTTVANGNTVGAIPFFINGGISIYTPLIGYACENILSAKLITASGSIVETSSTSHPDLFWAVCGAGQFFGVVLELQVRTYPLSFIGNPEGTRQMGTFIFMPQQAADVCRVMTKIMEDENSVTAGHMMVVAAPPEMKQQVVMAAPQLFGTAEQATELFKPLADLGPVHQMQWACSFETHSDHLAFMCVKGEFKRFNQVGLDGFNTENFLKMVDLHAKLLAECPGAERSGYTTEWHSKFQGRVERVKDTAFGCQGVDHWLNVFSWYTSPSQHHQIASLDHAVQDQMRVGTKEKAFISYTNTSREDPMEYRYKGEDRIARLKTLKREWDPKGVFTKELL